MAKSIKELGVKELEAFQTRLRRQHAMKRIREADYRFMETKLGELFSRIENLDEIDDDFVGGR